MYIPLHILLDDMLLTVFTPNRTRLNIRRCNPTSLHAWRPTPLLLFHFVIRSVVVFRVGLPRHERSSRPGSQFVAIARGILGGIRVGVGLHVDPDAEATAEAADEGFQVGYCGGDNRPADVHLLYNKDRSEGEARV
jgi:hypothetical protein